MPKGYRHGMRYTKIYRVWASIVSRTNYPGDTCYKNYGARGIKVCERWRKFESFFEDMGKEYKPGLEIDRIDVNGNYEPENCRWVTRKKNALNKRTSRLLTFEGKTKTMKEWSIELNMPYQTLSSRINNYGFSAERALTQKVISKPRNKSK